MQNLYFTHNRNSSTSLLTVSCTAEEVYDNSEGEADVTMREDAGEGEEQADYGIFVYERLR